MKIAVVGGNGFIGREFVKYASDNGQDVVVIGSDCDIFTDEGEKKATEILKSCQAMVLLAAKRTTANFSMKEYVYNIELAEKYMSLARETQIENVIITWDNYYIFLSNYYENENDEGLYYKSYYSNNYGTKKELIDGELITIKGDVSCIAIEFGPDMHLNYKYEEGDYLKKLDKLHSLFKNTFYIPVSLFERSKIEIYGTKRINESNTIEVEQLNGIYFNYKVTEKLGRKLVNVKRRNNNNETVIYNEKDKLEYEQDKEGNVTFKLNDNIIPNENDNNEIYTNIIISKEKDDDKNEIVKDDKWKELFENYIKEKTQSDIHQDVSGSGYVRNAITNQSNTPKPRSKKPSQEDNLIDDLLQEI